MTSQLDDSAALPCAHCRVEFARPELIAVAEYPLCKPCLETLARDLPALRPAKKQRFYKIRKGKEIEGVCGGLADAFNMDRDNVRVLSALLIVLTGIVPGLVVYVVLAFILPLDPSESVPEPTKTS
ncbi:MAG: PspC domain-containing protein [Planctomycetota bacterium]